MKMKKIITLMAILLVGSVGFAQSGAKIDFSAKDNTIDYGKVSKSSDNGVRVFEFTNTGNAPLIITSIQSTSNCTILSSTKDTILPGKKGKIEIKYNMTAGPIRKTITVESNAVNYEEGRVALKIKGEVIAN
jgi:LEA14-like dessication related protein